MIILRRVGGRAAPCRSSWSQRAGTRCRGGVQSTSPVETEYVEGIQVMCRGRDKNEGMAHKQRTSPSPAMATTVPGRGRGRQERCCRLRQFTKCRWHLDLSLGRWLNCRSRTAGTSRSRHAIVKASCWSVGSWATQMDSCSTSAEERRLARWWSVGCLVFCSSASPSVPPRSRYRRSRWRSKTYGNLPV